MQNLKKRIATYRNGREPRKDIIMKKANATSHFCVDFINHTISGSKASFKKASVGKGEYYEELTTLAANHPNFEMVVKEQQKRTAHAKRTYNGMDFLFMENYIKLVLHDEMIAKEYDAVKEMAKKSGKSVYPFTKKWFLNRFNTEENPFDIDDAKEAITKAQFAEAEKTANAPAMEEGAKNTSNDQAQEH